MLYLGSRGEFSAMQLLYYAIIRLYEQDVMCSTSLAL